MICLKKHVNDDGIEYISAVDIFKDLDENNSKAQRIYQFLALVEDELNYYVDRNCTAYGDPDLARAEGKVIGYCMAKGWNLEEQNGEIRVSKGKRTLFIIEKPDIPIFNMED